MKLVDGYQPSERVQLVTGQQGIVLAVEEIAAEAAWYQVHFGVSDRAPVVAWVGSQRILEPEHVVTPEEIVARGDAHLVARGGLVV